MKQYLCKEWDRKLLALLWCVIAFQYVHLLAHITFGHAVYLLPETIDVITYSLLICTFVQWILNSKPWIRFAVQFFLIAIFVYGFSHIHQDQFGIFARLKYGMVEITSFGSILYWTFLLYALLTAILYNVLLMWGKHKALAYIWLMISVLVFSIVDSFSEIELWDQVVWILIAGLLILMMIHFTDFKMKHPSGWESLIHRPWPIVTRIFILMLSISLIAVSSPSVKPTLTDPYTAFQTWRGKEVSKIGEADSVTSELDNDKAYLSGYSRDDSELGSGFEFDYTPLFRVDTDEKSYWRGETRSFYTGRGWESDTTDVYRSLADLKAGDPLPEEMNIDQSKRETKTILQTITVLKEQAYPVLFGAYQTRMIKSIDGRDDGLDHLSISLQDGSIHWTPLDEREEYPQVYSILSEIPVINEEQLREAPLEYPRLEQMADYLQIPETLPLRVKELALELTEDEPSAYGKAKRIEQYLKESFPYTNHPDISKRTSDDFVDAFLFEIQQGYCDYYSTAMAVMLRTIGIPTRWVKGYTSGYPLPEEPYLDIPEEYVVEDENTSGTYTVVNADAHSWVEVYFEGVGWIPFEPTSQFTLPAVYSQTSEPMLSLEGTDEQYQEQTEQSDERNAGGSSDAWIAIASLLSVAAALMIAIIFRFKGVSPWFHRQYGKHQPLSSYNHLLVFEFDKLIQYAKKQGLKIHEHETVKEVVIKWSAMKPSLEKDVMRLYRLFEKAKYSGSLLNEGEWQEAKELLEKLKGEIPVLSSDLSSAKKC